MANRLEKSRGGSTAPVASMFSGRMRECQANRLYRLGFGDILGCRTFHEYLSGTDAVEPVPDIPVFSPAKHMVFGDQRENIFLVDGRVPKKIGWSEYCKRLGLVSKVKDEEVVHWGLERVEGCSGIRWMIGQAGIRYQGLSVSQAQYRFESIDAAGAFDEVGMNAIEGSVVFAMAPKIIKDRIFHLPSSVKQGLSGSCACLGIFRDGPEIGWWWRGHAASDIAVATCGGEDALPRLYEPSPLSNSEGDDFHHSYGRSVRAARFVAEELRQADPQGRLQELRLMHSERLRRVYQNR